MPELIIQTSEPVAPEPFGEAEPDAVAAATGVYVAVDTYLRDIEEGVIALEDGMELGKVEATLGIAEYRLSRAHLAATPSTGLPDKSLEIKYAVQCDDRADAPTGAYAPIKLTTQRDVSREDLQRIYQEGHEMAALEAYAEWQYKVRAYAEAAEFDEQDAEVIESALRYAFLKAEEPWQRMEAIWLADKHNFGKLAEELTTLNWDHETRHLGNVLGGVTAAVSRAGKVVYSLSRLSVVARLMF